MWVDGGGAWGRWRAKLSTLGKRHLLMLRQIAERKEHGDLSRARSRRNVKEKRHGEQHTVSWA